MNFKQAELLKQFLFRWAKTKKKKILLNVPQSCSSFTLMGDNEEVLIMDLIALQFTLQHLGWHYFVQLAGEKKKIQRFTQICKQI